MNSRSLGRLQPRIGYLTTMQERSEFMMSFKGRVHLGTNSLWILLLSSSGVMGGNPTHKQDCLCNTKYQWLKKVKERTFLDERQY